MKLFRPTRLKMTLSGLTLALTAGAAFMVLGAEPAHACSPGGGSPLSPFINIISWLLGR
ncbi:MAG: hypothetical protein LPK88_03985 [Alphaproteobacteria bacterium]|nr:hypothetical protein [Alphaproteobacteria bacterium]MDX5415462.1 hypothetical protein [Alphaproteobacteria bacterium]MDX5492693.1 hypothetical protein [Alphaproteobacteria bacterium]